MRRRPRTVIGGFTPGFRTKNPSLFVFLAPYKIMQKNRTQYPDSTSVPYSAVYHSFLYRHTPIPSRNRQPQSPPSVQLQSKTTGVQVFPGGPPPKTMHSPRLVSPCLSGVCPLSSIRVHTAPFMAESQLIATSHSNHRPQHQLPTPAASLDTPPPPTPEPDRRRTSSTPRNAPGVVVGPRAVRIVNVAVTHFNFNCFRHTLT